MTPLKNSHDLGLLIKQLRHTPKGVSLEHTRSKLTTQALADLAGVSRDTVVRAERGEEIAFGTALALLRVFGVGLGPAYVQEPQLIDAHTYYGIADE